MKIHKNIYNRQTGRNKQLLIVLGAVVLILGALFLSRYYMANNQARTITPAQSPESKETLNLDPPTEEDKLRVEQNKQAILDREWMLQNQQGNNNKKTVKPLITYAGQYGAQIEVGAYVTGVFEDGGTCTANFSKGTLSLSKTVNSLKGATSVDCPVMEIKNEDFTSKGIWTVTVSYDSSTASGSSDPKQVEVQ